jgi:hypothetical protein
MACNRLETERKIEYAETAFGPWELYATVASNAPWRDMETGPLQRCRELHRGRYVRIVVTTEHLYNPYVPPGAVTKGSGEK